MHAVPLQVVPRLVLRDALVHPVRLDQAQEGLKRQAELRDRGPKLAQHRPRRLAAVAGLDLPLELVEELQPVPFGLVPEDVHEPAVAVQAA